ncbi:DUF4430 domain-containing protein [Ornithinibacillus xuwenensis]|uniref:DUF4430 domain-containing protein n=1 Tax=Ornithinibacillus xuwenensis TaxID=3144668 RepID=A0ABU9XF26_9BACI
MFKRILSTLLIAVLIVFNIPPKESFINAAEASSDTVSVNVRVEAYNRTIVEPTEVEVGSFDLQQYVGGTSPITTEDPRAIHAIIRALESAGINTLDKNEFDLGYGGNYIAGIDGLWEFDRGGFSGWMYYIDNQFVPVGVLDRKITDGESIVVFYVDNYNDNTYSWFDQEHITAEVGEPISIKQNGLVYDTWTNEQTTGPVEGSTILVNNDPYLQGGNAVVTDENGMATVTFDEAGTYTLSAERKSGELTNISRPYAQITVEEAPPEDTTPPSVTVDTLTDGMVVEEPELTFRASATDEIDGSITPTIKLNDTKLNPQQDGQFKASLLEGKNVIQVTAVDSNQNKVTKSYNVTYQSKKTTNYNIEDAMKKASNHMLHEGIISEWQAIGLARAGVSIPNEYLQIFDEAIQSQIVEQLESQRVKITDIERLAIAAVALGKDPQDINGLDLIELIYNSPERRGGYDTMTFQGNNGPIFALIALDSNAYTVPSDAKWNRQRLIAELLRTQNEDGSWNLNEYFSSPSIDITAMAITGLSPYKDQAPVKEALDKAVDYLSSVQTDEGGFDGGSFVGGVTSEATSQVIIGLTAYGIDPTGSDFTKNGNNLVDHLLSFQLADGGFQHTSGDSMSNSMATEQAYQALVAYQLYQHDGGSLYQFPQSSDPVEKVINLNEQVDVTKNQVVKIKGSKTQVVMPDDLPEGTKLIVREITKQSPGLEKAGDVFNFEFQFPDGKQPKGSYQLTMGVNSGVDLSKTGIYYLNEQTEAWEYVGGWGDAKDEVITVQVDHFSTYGVFTDTEGPSEPQVTEKSKTSDSISLGLSADDPSGIKEYIIYRDGKQVAVVPGTDAEYVDTALKANQVYQYTVVAVDYVGNNSTEGKISVRTKEKEAANDEQGNSGSGTDKGDGNSTDGKTGHQLPNTATNIYNYLLIGVLLLAIGGVMLLVQKRRALSK